MEWKSVKEMLPEQRVYVIVSVLAMTIAKSKTIEFEFLVATLEQRTDARGDAILIFVDSEYNQVDRVTHWSYIDNPDTENY